MKKKDMTKEEFDQFIHILNVIDDILQDIKINGTNDSKYTIDEKSWALQTIINNPPNKYYENEMKQLKKSIKTTYKQLKLL